MNMEKTDWLERLAALPVIDVHEHFETYGQTFGYTLPRYLYFCSYAVCYSGYFDPADAALLDDASGDPRQQYEALLRMLRVLRHTRTERLLNGISARAGIPIAAGRYDELCAWYAGRTPDAIRRCTPTIRAYICNSAGHPLYGDLAGLSAFLAGERTADAEMRRTLSVHGLHCIQNAGQLRTLGALANVDIHDLKSWETACQWVVQQFVNRGIVAFKELYLYFRPPQIDAPDPAGAARDFDRLLRGEPASKRLLDTLLFGVYELLAATGLPVQVHTGAAIATAETACHLTDYMRLMHAFPAVAFDLLHLNYPMLELYQTVLRSCPNAYGDCTWVFTADGDYAKRYLRWAADVLPVERTLAFGADRHCAGEAVAAALEQAQALLAEFFAGEVARGALSPSAALEIARLWLFDNANTLFGLKIAP